MAGSLLSVREAVFLRWQAILLVIGLSAAVFVRLLASGTAGARSPTGGLVFAGCLAVLCAAAGVRIPKPLSRAVLPGLAGGLALAAVALLRSGLTLPAVRDAQGFLPWLAVTATVAVTEEALLREALYSALVGQHGEAVAVVIGAGAFAGLHVPLYGWQVLPLDFAVGLSLGMLRLLSGTWASAALAHVLADAAGWWLR